MDLKENIGLLGLGGLEYHLLRDISRVRTLSSNLYTFVFKKQSE